jgi:hypothetical protein
MVVRAPEPSEWDENGEVLKSPLGTPSGSEDGNGDNDEESDEDDEDDSRENGDDDDGAAPRGYKSRYVVLDSDDDVSDAADNLSDDSQEWEDLTLTNTQQPAQPPREIKTSM